MSRSGKCPKLRTASATSVTGREIKAKRLPKAIRSNKMKNGFMGDLQGVSDLTGLTNEPRIAS